MEQSLPSDTHSCSASQNIPHPLWYLKVSEGYCVYTIEHVETDEFSPHIHTLFL
jgi:hypothetical protein